jgi:hypothetical protein
MVAALERRVLRTPPPPLCIICNYYVISEMLVSSETAKELHAVTDRFVRHFVIRDRPRHVGLELARLLKNKNSVNTRPRERD